MRSALRLLARTGVEPATIADVGAADGGWSRLAGRTFPTAELVLFEPQPVHATALDRFNVEHPEATVFHSAVGGASGTSHFDAEDPWGGVLLQKEKNADSITVSVVTLDDALAAAKPPFLVKLDTHGVEAEILEGAQQTLGRSVAWIVEAYNYRITPDCLLFWDLCDYMAAHGFRPIDLVDVMHRPHDHTLWQMDVAFVRSDWAGFDYLGYT
jgi:FkbM family methyltransferase